METLAYLVEVRDFDDFKPVAEAFGDKPRHGMLEMDFSFETTMDGQRLLRRWVPEVEKDAVVELPEASLSRYAFKMATGSGKTVVMAMAIAWSYFNIQQIYESRQEAWQPANAVEAILGRPPRQDLAAYQPSMLERIKSLNNLAVFNECRRTIFNECAVYNDLEVRFAQFLDSAPDVLRFAALAESYTRFRVDYLSSSGAVKLYYPDFVAVQRTPDGEINWIIETKGREYEDVEHKDASIADWCSKISAQTGQAWRYLKVPQRQFDASKAGRLAELVAELEQERLGLFDLEQDNA